MSITPQDFLDLAQTLNKGTGEAHHRSATSRAYYAAYHACLDWQKALPGMSSSSGVAGGVHQQLINRLRNPAPEVKDESTRKLSKVLATRLDLLRNRRKIADYSLQDSYCAVLAANDLSTATLLLNNLSAGNASVSPPPALAPSHPPVGSLSIGRAPLKRVQ